MAGSGADLSATDGRRLPIGLGEQEGGRARAVQWEGGTATSGFLVPARFCVQVRGY